MKTRSKTVWQADGSNSGSCPAMAPVPDGTPLSARKRSRSVTSTAVLLCVLPFFSVAANPDIRPELLLPIDCDVTDGCLIQNYFDHDRSSGFSDYQCGYLGYDGHTGTDFRLRNLVEMRAGVPVRAAARGEVRAIRDAMPDISIREAGQREKIIGREAGNSVAIRHGNGWETQYSHLRRGSVKVKPGDYVDAGQVIGLIGLSGKTEFPHVHFTVRYKGTPVDPFVGTADMGGCGDQDKTLWAQEARRQLGYRSVGLIQAGFSQRKPEVDVIEAGGDDQPIIDDSAAALVFWAELYGIREGDEQHIRILNPQGKILVENRSILRKNKAQWLSYVGKRRREDRWAPGSYRGEYRLYRSDSEAPLVEATRDLEVR